MILVSQSYRTSCDKRNAELDKCRRRNEESDIFSKVEYIDAYDQPLTFNELFDHCVCRYRGKVCVIANSDIAFGHTAYAIQGMSKPGRLVSLTRWESHSGPLFAGFVRGAEFFSGSQDSWAFLAGGVPAPEVEIPMGQIGCDQIIVGWYARAGVEVVNPAISVRTMHCHADTSREKRTILTGYFGYPQLTALNTTGRVMFHHWPHKNGKWEIEWE